MRDSSGNPAGDGRDARPRADEPKKDTQSKNDVERTPRLVVVAAAVLAFVVCPVSFALGHVGVGIAAAIAGLLGFGAGLDWLAMERRRVRQTEREWLIDHPTE